MPKIVGLTLVLGIFAIFISCSEQSETQEEINKDKIILQYKKTIGDEHNNVLSLYYAPRIKSRTVSVVDEETYFNDFFGITEDSKILRLPKPLTRSNEDVENLVIESLVTEMILEGLVDLNAATYMEQVEQVLKNPPENSDEIRVVIATMQAAVTDIEYQAISSLNDKALYEFMSYAETAKASLLFWAENYETLTESELEESSTMTKGWFSNLINNTVKKITKAAESDAAGAAAGAAVGAAIGALVSGAGAGPGAAIGAVTAGAASSICGFNSAKLCIVIDYSKIQSEIIMKSKK